MERESLVFDKSRQDLGSVRVVAFSGRQNPQEGLWGKIAEQLGKKKFFKDPVQYVS